MSTVKLYGYSTSPFVRKTACFLLYKGVEFEHVPVSPLDPAETIGFTDGTQVPVLEIDGEWKRESSAHAYWLDKVFPEKPICPARHAQTIADIDEWVSNTFLPGQFRAAIDGGESLDYRFRGWRLAAIVSAQTPLPEEVRHIWPDAVKHAPFIQAMGAQMDLTESHADMQIRIEGELADHIGDGPFIGGIEHPTMLDLAIFPQLVFGYLFGLEEQVSAVSNPVIKDWMGRVAKHLPPNSTVTPNWLQVNSLDSLFPKA